MDAPRTSIAHAHAHALSPQAVMGADDPRIHECRRLVLQVLHAFDAPNGAEAAALLEAATSRAVSYLLAE